MTYVKGCETMHKEVRELVKEAERQGWRRRELPSGHVQLYAPDGTTIVTLPGTPSGGRWRANAVAQLRKGGFQWPPP